MAGLVNLGLVIAAFIGGHASALPPRFDAELRTQATTALAPPKAWESCRAKESTERDAKVKGALEASCDPSLGIALRDRWSDCLERFASNNWYEFARTGGSERLAAQRLFREGLRHCKSEGDALRVFVGDKSFREERHYNRDTIVESYTLRIIEDRASEI